MFANKVNQENAKEIENNSSSDFVSLSVDELEMLTEIFHPQQAAFTTLMNQEQSIIIKFSNEDYLATPEWNKDYLELTNVRSVKNNALRLFDIHDTVKKRFSKKDGLSLALTENGFLVWYPEVELTDELKQTICDRFALNSGWKKIPQLKYKNYPDTTPEDHVFTLVVNSKSYLLKGVKIKNRLMLFFEGNEKLAWERIYRNISAKLSEHLNKIGVTNHIKISCNNKPCGGGLIFQFSNQELITEEDVKLIQTVLKLKPRGRKKRTNADDDISSQADSFTSKPEQDKVNKNQVYRDSLFSPTLFGNNTPDFLQKRHKSSNDNETILPKGQNF